MDSKAFRQVYSDIRKINKGGIGTIYHAYQKNLGKEVVLKRIDSSQNLSMLRREVDILKNLRHSYLPTVYDFVEVKGVYYIVEDYINGTSLDYYFKNHIYIPEEYIKKWLKQMSEVLAYLHSQKPAIIHSDIKPGNIMVDSNGDICLIDFNISILHGKDSSVIGYSNHFCSPEQFAQANAIRNGKRAQITVDGRSDIFSTFATFYALITGIEPVCDRPNKKMSGCGLNYDDKLLRLIDRGMEFDPSKRFKSANEMKEALQNYDKPSSAGAAKKIFTSAAVFLVVAGIGAGGFGFVVHEKKNLQSDYNSAVSLYNTNSANEEIFSAASSIVDNPLYRALLVSDKQKLRTLYSMQGDYYYSCENYSVSAEKYGKAVQAFSPAEISTKEMKKTLFNYVSACTMAGNVSEAKSAAYRYSDEPDFVINAIDVEAAYREQKYDEVIASVEKIDGSSLDFYEKEKLYLFAATAANNKKEFEKASQWLQLLADSPEATDVETERLIAGLVDAGNASNDKEYFNRAAEAYLSIATPSPSARINYGIALFGLGRYSDCESVLNTVSTDDSYLLCEKNYYLSYSYLSRNLHSKAESCCNNAISNYHNIKSESQKKSVASNIKSLAQQLGADFGA